MGRSTRTALVALCVWYAAECAQNLMNKLLMQNPKHLLGSLELAEVNTLCSAVLDFAAIKLYFYPRRAAFLLTTLDVRVRRRAQPPLVTWARARELLPVALAMFVSKSLTMAAFKYIPLSLSNTIKMTQAAFTVVLGYLWLGKLPSVWTLLTLVPLLCGAALTVGTDLSFNTIGLLAIFGATCCATFQNLYFKNRVDLTSYPMYGDNSVRDKRDASKNTSTGKQSALVGRMVLVHMIIASAAFVLGFLPATMQEINRRSARATMMTAAAVTATTVGRV
jgi:drug/metabolite transporter (DMT)-like permease